MKAWGRLLLVILCSVGFSTVCLLLCCWACLPICLVGCLDPSVAPRTRPTVPGPLHFIGYSSVPDGKQARDTVYVVWGQGRHMDRTLGGRTYRTLLQLTQMYPGLRVFTFTERMMAYCDQVFQDETGKNRRQSGSFLSTGWFTMILALELCEEIVVYGMVSDSYCREGGHRSVPYHYFEKGRLDECQMYLAHERAPRSAHRFLTEKAVFSRWAKQRHIVFAHPSWGEQ